MKRFWIFILIIIFSAFLLRFTLSWHNFHGRLDQEYPGFLEQPIQRFLPALKIRILQNEGLSAPHARAELWKSLWILKDQYRFDYITHAQRNELISQLSRAEPQNLEDHYIILNTLKYKLGINSKEGLADPSICQYAPLVNWSDPWHASVGFDYLHFCKISLSEQHVHAYHQLTAEIGKDADHDVLHLQEHGVNDVPVYINDCSSARNENEAYHCLFFSDT
ncbi:MAG: hypothetical protein ACOCWQ_03530 [Nanoarchaeota archaeon]